MSTEWKKSWVLPLACIVTLFLSACQKEEEGEPEEQKPDETRDDPISGDPDPGPIEGRERVVIGNHEKEDDPGYSQEGVWEQSILPGFEGSISRYSSAPGARVQYASDEIGNARYCVSVYRVTHPNSTDKAQWRVFDGEEEKLQTTIHQNFSAERTGWVHLGEVEFSGTQTAKLILDRHPEANDGYLRADEVRFEKLKKNDDCHGKTYARIGGKGIIDNKNPPRGNDDGYREHGEWHESRYPGFKGDISRYSHGKKASVTYTFVPMRPNYCLSLFRVTHPNSVKKARVEVKQEDVILEEFEVDHRFEYDRSGWVELDRIELKTKRPAVVTIKRAKGAKGVLRADALKLEVRPPACR